MSSAKRRKTGHQEVSASSFLGLKAELAKREDELKRAPTGRAPAEAKRGDKKLPAWLRQNVGLSSRAARDTASSSSSSWANAPAPTLEASRAALERKARIYDKLARGKTGGLDERAFNSGLIDWDRKADEQEEYGSDGSGDVDESAAVPSAPLGEDDPLVEYTDDLGRTRTAPRSEVPREYLHQPDPEPEEEDTAVYGPSTAFPVYVPSAEKLELGRANATASPATHFDARAEVRSRGAGFFTFSGDEQTRLKQMEELKQAREETERERLRTGRTSEDEQGGQVANQAPPMSEAQKRREERRREIEERRKKALAHKEQQRKSGQAGVGSGGGIDGFLERIQREAESKPNASEDS